MKSLKEVFSETIGLHSKIGRVLELSDYGEYGDLSGLEADEGDSGQIFLLGELQVIMKHLDEVNGRLKYLSRPVKEVSRLHRNSAGRYETDGGHYYTSGNSIEALVQDGSREVPYWARTSVEHNGRDYYLVGYDGIKLDGLTVRVRGEA